MPGQYYVYVPYREGEANQELKDLAKAWRINAYNTFGENTRKVPKTLTSAEGEPLSILKDLDPDSYTLYIMAHCNVGRTTINNVGICAERLEMNAEELTNRMMGDGLPKSAKNIKLFACNAAIPTSGAAPELESFGARLFHSLKGQGLNSLVLSAYTKPLKAATVKLMGDGHKRTDNDERPSQHRRQWS